MATLTPIKHERKPMKTHEIGWNETGGSTPHCPDEEPIVHCRTVDRRGFRSTDHSSRQIWEARGNLGSRLGLCFRCRLAFSWVVAPVSEDMACVPIAISLTSGICFVSYLLARLLVLRIDFLGDTLSA
jgi:hypothetical protein